MDFHALLAKMKEIDSQPQATVNQITQECGDPMMTPPTMGNAPATQMPPPPSHPSMSVNLNAQGMDNIESMMRLFQKVNPDMMPKVPEPMPGLSPMPSITSLKPELPPLKMLPIELDQPKIGMDDGPEMGDSPEMNIGNTDNDSDEPADIDDIGQDIDTDDSSPEDDMEGPPESDDDSDEEKKDEDGGFQSATTEPDEAYRSVDYMNNKLAGGMNRPKDTFPKVAGGDNPMQKVKESDDAFRASIRAELQKRLNEAKGAK